MGWDFEIVYGVTAVWYTPSSYSTLVLLAVSPFAACLVDSTGRLLRSHFLSTQSRADPASAHCHLAPSSYNRPSYYFSALADWVSLQIHPRYIVIEIPWLLWDEVVGPFNCLLPVLKRDLTAILCPYASFQVDQSIQTWWKQSSWSGGPSQDVRQW